MKTTTAMAAWAAVVAMAASCGGSNGSSSGGPAGQDAGNVDGSVQDATADAPPGDSSTMDVTATDAADSMASADAPADAATSDATPDALADATPDSGCNAGPNQDQDGDGWTIAQGDCNDCDPLVNPGAIDVLHAGADGGAPYYTDDDCDGVAGDVGPCDTGLALADVDPADAAKALDLCRTTTATARTWGVLSSAYTRASGAAFAPALQAGLEPSFGPNVHVQTGKAMLVLSSGHARVTADPGACGSASCAENTGGTAPAGFPASNPSCPPSLTINDDIALAVTLRVPTNAVGYAFDFKFNSFEYPQWVCEAYNDQFIALASPAPAGSINGNVSFDSLHAPISVNAAFFGACDPSAIGTFASNCIMGGGTCPSPPSPYCPLGTSQLAGTGFDVWAQNGSSTYGGATSWLTTQAPVAPGSQITIRFLIWDGGDQSFDSTVLLDSFRWITAPGTVVVATTPVASPI
jgi:hypothetical protein